MGTVEKEVEIALSTLHQKLNEVKGSLMLFMRKLEMGKVLWPDVSDNYTTLSGQLNMLQKVLNKEKTPPLQNLVLLPLLTSQGMDQTLEQITEGRIPYLTADTLPSYLRTKLELDIEKTENDINKDIQRISELTIQQQLCDINNLSDSMTEMIQNMKDSWDDSTALSNTQHFDNDPKELIKLVSALDTGKGLRINPRRNNPR